jgi:sigma-B regulation protein RsbQ
MDVLKRNNVAIRGQGEAAMMFAHGFGCDHNMWRFVAPAFEADHRTVTFDHVGAGGSDLASYNAAKYASLDGYADDIIEIARALKIEGGIFVGHSVSAMMGVLASNKAPGLFSALVLVGPSPSYIDEDNYQGGFTRPQIEELLESLDTNYLGWSRTMAPVIMGNADRQELGDELTNSFCRTNPEIAKEFARTTFLSDTRDALGRCDVRSLILQCSQDVIAPQFVGEYVHSHMPNSELVLMKATGHCPNLSAPEETTDAIKTFLNE